MAINMIVVEILCAALGLGLLAAGLILPDRGQKYLGKMAVAGVAALIGITIYKYQDNAVLFSGIYHVDLYGSFFKLLILLAAGLVFLMAARYGQKFASRRSEWYGLVFFAVLGMMVMAGAGEMITLYAGLELSTISLYILSAYLVRSPRSAEAGLKYLVLGALSSAILLYGLSLVYAATGTTIFSRIYAFLAGAGPAQPVLVAGLFMVLAGFGFKVAAVPFHMWSPDVYEGAPTPVSAFLSVASKAAAFAALMRILWMAFPPDIVNWNEIMAVLAAVTMVGGNLAALVQTDLKRLLAYSSISQAGYLLVGLIAANGYGLQGVLFYSLLYVFANAGAFAVVCEVEMESGRTDIAAFSNLGERAPLLAAVMTICLLSLAGIPPLAGFTGKYYLFSGAVQAGYFWLVMIGLLMSMISVYYYLNVSRVMYTGQEEEPEPEVSSGFPSRLLLWSCLLVTIIVGIAPEPISRLAAAAAGILL